ncbi:MAG: fatty-acid oxidation protein subunit alpha [Chloroflexi bacterium]|nr:fatty-acid oxidation protein subunit alpha [Chloroflexota bacterium]
MPARDRFHEAVKKGLQRDGWTITADPLYIEFGGVDLYVDLAADKVIAAEKEGRKIAVEIKSFIAPSLIFEFHTALGQFINYRTALQAVEPDRQLYLAVPEDTYRMFFTLPFTQEVIAQQGVNVLVYDAEQEVIVAWHE